MIGLPAYFMDANDPLTSFTWNVGTGGSSAISAAWVDSCQFLHLAFAQDIPEQSHILVRGTDPSGAFDETEFDVWSAKVASVDGAYEDENGQWITPTASDPFWDFDNVQWTVTYEPTNLPILDSVEILRMPWSQWESMGEQFDPNNPLANWFNFVSAAPTPSPPGVLKILGNPGGGERWAITAKLNFAGKFGLHWVAKETLVPKIDHVEWDGIEVAAEDNLWSDGLLGDLRFFPEKNEYDADDSTTHEEVMFRVFLQPAELNLKVFAKAFDPDDPSASTGPIDNDGTGGPAQDNRGADTELEGGKLISTDEIVGAFAVANKRFKPTNALGNNYRVVAAGRKTHFEHIETRFGQSPVEVFGSLEYDDGPGGADIMTLFTSFPQDIPKALSNLKCNPRN